MEKIREVWNNLIESMEKINENNLKSVTQKNGY